MFSGENGITAYDIEKDSVLWQDTAHITTSVAVSDDKSSVAALVYSANKDENENKSVIYSVYYDGNEFKDMKNACEVSFGGKKLREPADDSFLNPHDRVFTLSNDGTRLCVSFADGSLSVFDTSGTKETVLYTAPENSEPAYFSGGFCGDTLAFSVVEENPYHSGLYIYNVSDMENIEDTASYESDSSHFLPVACDSGLYVAYEDRIMSVDTQTGGLTHILAANGPIETFGKNADYFVVCEKDGAYRFSNTADGSTRTYQSSYTCNFTDIGAAYALTGSYDSKTVRILKRSGASDSSNFALISTASQNQNGDFSYSYDKSYKFAEVKVQPKLDRAVFYSYRGFRLCDLNKNIIAEFDFPNPDDVLDTRYDSASGNIAVLYKDELRLYSGVNGSLLLDKQGKSNETDETDITSVIYTDLGLSVLDETGEVAIYDLSTAQTVSAAKVNPDADCAVIVGNKILESVNGGIFFDSQKIYDGKIIGAGKIKDGVYAFAVSDETAGRVFIVNIDKDGNAVLSDDMGFDFDVLGRAEAYFTGGYVFISPMHGNASAYAYDGKPVRTLDENGRMAETGVLGNYIIAGYVSASMERYSLILTGDNLETMSYLPGFMCGITASDGGDSPVAVFDDGAGNLRSEKLLSVQELIALSKNCLNGRTLTAEEKIKFNVE